MCNLFPTAQSNHVEFTDCYHTPLEEFFEKGAEFAKKWDCKGILFPVGLLPKGICSEYTPQLELWFERLFLGQKSNAIHPADIMVFRWNSTKDTAYAKNHAYPYLKGCLAFFEDWMIYENGRYSVKKDAAHEVPYYKPNFDPKKYKRYINDKNNCLTLGMLRLCIPAAIEMAEALGIDKEKQEKWREILDKLSPFPTYFRFFKKVFRYTEKGQRWNDGNDVGLQHIYPAGCVGVLKSDKKTFKIAKNTFKQKEKYCYIDDNAICSFFPIAARLGKNPEHIVQKLHELNEKKLLPNMLYNFEGGCLENCPIFANTLNEMVLQSFEGIVRIFPCWESKTNVKFRALRADGAFLISSEMKDGVIPYVEIVSEMGETLRIQNPYRAAKVRIDESAFATDEEFISIKTVKGSKIRLTNNNV